MPGTIHVSVIELEPPPPASPTPTVDGDPSSLSLKVTTGKREYQTTGNMELSFPIVSLRDDLVVMLYGSDGNLITRTEFKIISVVEKGVLDNSFSLEGGVTVHVRLQFLLSEEERLRIHDLRNSKLKRKHGDLLKADLKNNISVAGETVGETMPTYNSELKMEGTNIRQSKHINKDEHNDLSTSSTQPAVQDAENHTQDLLDSQRCKPSEKDEGTDNIILYTKGIQGREIVLEDSSDCQREHVTSITSGNAMDEITPSAKLEDRRTNRNSFAISTRSNVRTMISVFEKSPSQGLESNVVSSVLLLSKNQAEGSLKRTSSEESIAKRLVHQTMTKSFSSGTLSDINSQNNSNFHIPHLAKKQEGKQPTKTEAKVNRSQFLDFDQKVKNIGPDVADQNFGKEIHLENVYRHENQDKNPGFLKEIKQSRSIISESLNTDDPCGTGTLQQVFYCRFCKGHIKEQLPWNLFEPTELLCTRTEEYVFDTFGIWTPRHLCITTGSKQLKNLLERCSRCLRSLSMEEKFRPEADEKESVFGDSSVAVTKNENISSQSPGHVDVEDVTSNSNLYGKLIDQGVRIIIVIVACGTLLLRTR